jgi:hypothetical protein
MHRPKCFGCRLTNAVTQVQNYGTSSYPTMPPSFSRRSICLTSRRRNFNRTPAPMRSFSAMNITPKLSTARLTAAASTRDWSGTLPLASKWANLETEIPEASARCASSCDQASGNQRSIGHSDSLRSTVKRRFAAPNNQYPILAAI